MSSLSLPFFPLFSFQCALFFGAKPLGGDEQNRTVDPLLARQVLSQLSYAPISSQSASPPSVPHSLLQKMVGPSGLEPPTSRLSVVRSSQLSYGPIFGLSPSSLEYALSTL